MNSYEAYQKYVGIKLHFQQDKYDYIKYNKSVKTSKQKFLLRKDKYFFDKICKIYNDKEFESLLISNFLKKSDLWVGDLLTDSCRQNFQDWKKINQSLEYIFKQDLIIIQDHMLSENLQFNELFTKKVGNWTPIVNLSYGKIIHIETFIIMNKILSFFNKMDKIIDDELIWTSYKKNCLKYSSFIDIDIKKYKKIMKNIFYEKS